MYVELDGPGIVVYSVDGFEDVKAEDVTTDMFSMKAYHQRKSSSERNSQKWRSVI